MATKLKRFLLWTIIFFLLVAVFFSAFKFISYFFPYLSRTSNLASICPGSGDSGDNLCCTPNCAGKTCGDDGCGGSCGTCSSGQTCNSSYQCVFIDVVCTSNCTNKQCGDNGCGGSCGTCSVNNECNVNGQCVVISEAVTHKICNESEQCVSVTGEGFGECNNDLECGPTHNGCSVEKKCEIIIGEGSDLCQSNNDCNPVAGDSGGDIAVNGGVSTLEKIQEAINTLQGSIITKAISTAGVAIATAQVAAAVIVSPFNFLLLFFRLSGIFLTALGLKKRIKPWGVVYDSATKQPLDPAYVVLSDLEGKKIASAITDLDGRYGFLANPGIYKMSVNKTNYIFPSQKLLGKSSDEFYDDLYFGQGLEIKKEGDTIAKNIPMDSLKFDWNEFAKKDKRLMKFYSRLDIILKQIFDLFFVVGFVMAIVAYFAAPYPYNLVILLIYLALLFLRIIGIKPKAYGRILSFKNGGPLSFALVKIIAPDTNVEIAHKVSDKYGRYYCLVPKGKYFVKIAKKNDDGSYFPAFVSPVIDASKKGIIKNNFRI